MIPHPNLKAWWSFSEDSGTSVADMSGNSNTGTLFGTYSREAGSIGKALKFTGAITNTTRGYVDVTNSTSINPTNITIATRIKVTAIAIGEQRTIIEKGFTSHNPPYYQYGMHLVRVGGFGARLWCTINGTFQVTPNSFTSDWFALNNYVHLAGTFDGTNLKMYVNGLERTEVRTNAPGSISSYATGLKIGAHVNVDSDNLHAVVDDVQIYNIALTDAEIKRLANTFQPLRRT